MNVRAVVARRTSAFVPVRTRGSAATAWITALLLALAAFVLVADPAHAQSVREYSAGITQAPSPRGIVLGHDGNIWFTEQTGNRIGRITPAGVVTEFSAGLSPGVNPGGMALGPDNNVWFVERSGNKIGMIIADPANGTVGTITEFGGLTASSLPVAIAAGPDGNLWFTESTGNRIGRITTSGTVTEFSAGITAGASPTSIAAGPDGNLWFTEYNIDRVAKITTGGTVTEYGAGITAGSNPNGIAAGPDGNLWFTETTGSQIGKITTAGVVTEYAAGITAGSSPRNIFAGPDGNLWFTETTGNQIGQITTAGVVTEFNTGITPGAQPWGIAAGSDGNLWFTEYAAGQIGQITTAGVVTEFYSGITPDAGPYDIAAGPDGNLWFTEQDIDRIGRITPGGVVTEFSFGITPGAAPAGIAAGPDGNLWFTEQGIDRIGRITTAGVVTEYGGLTSGAAPTSIALGPDNNMWFAEPGGGIGRIIALLANGTVGSVTEFTTGITSGASPFYIAAGPDGNLWFTEQAIDSIGRITITGNATEFGTGITAGASPFYIAAGPDGNLWFTEAHTNKIGRIPPSGSATEFTTGTGQRPTGITTGPDGNLWYADRKGNQIGRITPAGVSTVFPAGITAGATPFGITAGPDGNLWFTEPGINRVARITTTSDFVVTNNNDSGAGSLRDAVAQANVAAGAPMITFAPAVTGTILLTSGQINVNQAMTIAGPGAATLTIDANASSRIFSIFQTDPACPALDGPDYTVSISGLRLTNAQRHSSNGAGAIFTEHSLSLDSVQIDNSIAGSGGGLYFQLQYPGQTLAITNSQFLNNKAQPIGPSATTDSGGALAIFEKCAVHTSPVTVNITGSVFSGNQSLPTTLNGFGGAIAADSVADITITDSRITGNAVILPSPPVVTQIYRGGGIYAHAKSLTVVRTEISGNSLVDATGADLSRGGGVHLFNNASDLQGAGNVFAATFVNSTISGNTSPATAGGVFVVSNVALELDNSTVAENSAAVNRTGGVLFTTSATVPPTAGNADAPTFKLVSSIVANSQVAVTDLATNLATMPTFNVDSTNSLIENICPSPSCVITVTGTGNLTAIDPMLGPLTNNGGPTQTQALLAGSPAIDTGSNPLSLTTDQRGAGFPRVVGAAADMGAYEFAPSVAAPVLQGIVSRKVHGASGTFDRVLTFTTPPTINHAPTIEPRAGPTFQLVFTYDKPLNAATATVTEGVATPSSSIVGNTVVVNLTAVNDVQYVTVSLTSVGSTDGGTGGVGAARVGFLKGDVNSSRLVAVTDLVVVNNQLGKPLTAANFVSDVNASGIITVLDKVVVNNALGHFLPTP